VATDNIRINQLLDVLAKRPFRAGFRLQAKELAIIEDRGWDVIRLHATDLITARLAPAHPLHDGRQTPYGGHPVFVGQHATATCCRNCLQRWHHIPKGLPLRAAEIDYAVTVLLAWMQRQTSL
jgi:hypothetical protein